MLEKLDAYANSVADSIDIDISQFRLYHAGIELILVLSITHPTYLTSAIVLCSKYFCKRSQSKYFTVIFRMEITKNT
jgi:hypothetical protein